MLFYLRIIQLTVCNRTVTRFIAGDKIVYQRVRREIRLASDNSWARRRLKHLTWRSRWIILCTFEQRMAVSHEISRADRCLFGLSSWAQCLPLLRDERGLPLQLYPSCRFSSADCRCFQVSDPSREIHATTFMHHTALTDNFNQNPIFLWNFHYFV